MELWQHSPSVAIYWADVFQQTASKGVCWKRSDKQHSHRPCKSQSAAPKSFKIESLYGQLKNHLEIIYCFGISNLNALLIQKRLIKKKSNVNGGPIFCSSLLPPSWKWNVHLIPQKCMREVSRNVIGSIYKADGKHYLHSTSPGVLSIGVWKECRQDLCIIFRSCGIHNHLPNTFWQSFALLAITSPLKYISPNVQLK